MNRLYPKIKGECIIKGLIKLSCPISKSIIADNTKTSIGKRITLTKKFFSIIPIFGNNKEKINTTLNSITPNVGLINFNSCSESNFNIDNNIAMPKKIINAI